MVIRLLITDDRPQVRQGLRMYLALNSDIDIVGEAENGQDAIQHTFELQPSLVLMDLLMPVMDGIAATRAIKRHQPQTLIVVMTSTQDEELLRAALLAGADGYVQKTISPERLSATLKHIAEGYIPLTSDLLRKFTALLSPQAPPLDAAEIALLRSLVEQRSTAMRLRVLQCDLFAFQLALNALQIKLALSSPLLLAAAAVYWGLAVLPVYDF